jgi:uncharacterized FlaG/YvyC family protein
MTEGIDAIGPVSGIGAIDVGGAPASAPSTPSPSVAPAVSPPRQAAASPPAPATLDAALRQINAHLSDSGRTLELRVDVATGLTVAAVLSTQTGEVIQQFPSEDVLRLAEMLNGWAHGKSSLLDLIA